jgi:hypothetical protein
LRLLILRSVATESNDQNLWMVLGEAAALHAEVAAYIEQFADRRPRRGDFNGVNEGLGDAVITSQAVHLLIAV